MSDPTSYELKMGDGVLDTFTFSFPYLQTIDIEVSVNGIDQQVGADFNFIGPNSIQFSSPPANGLVVLIRRNSVKNGSIVDFTRGSLTEEDLDQNRLQAFYAAEESIDLARDTISISPVSGQYDVDGLRVVNAAPGVDETDLATIGQLAPFASAAQSAQAAAEAARDAAVSAETVAVAARAVAETERTFAEIAAAAAEARYDSFDDRYLGEKSSAPTVDNDGGPLLIGALYFNSTNSTMFVWTGSLWSMLPAAGHNHEDLFYHRPMFHGREEFASGVQSGSSVAGWMARDPNTIIKNEIPGAYKAIIGIGLPAGRYYVSAAASSTYPSVTRLGLFSLVLGIDLKSHLGLSQHGAPSGNNSPIALMSGEFTLPSADIIVPEQWIGTARATNGRGVSLSLTGVPECFSDIKIWKLA